MKVETEQDVIVQDVIVQDVIVDLVSHRAIKPALWAYIESDLIDV